MDGPYYVTRNAIIGVNNISGEIKLIIEENLEISASNYHFTPYCNELVLLSNGSLLKISGGNVGYLKGIIHVTNGKIDISGS